MVNLAERYFVFVDDEADLLDVLVDCYSDLNTDIIAKCFADGEAAFCFIKGNSENIVAVMSDLSMPKMGGVELLKSVRELGLKIPFSLLTGYATEEAFKESIKYGAFDFLKKPYPIDDFIPLFNKMINQDGSRDKLSTEVDGLFKKKN